MSASGQEPPSRGEAWAGAGGQSLCSLGRAGQDHSATGPGPWHTRRLDQDWGVNGKEEVSFRMGTGCRCAGQLGPKWGSWLGAKCLRY